MERVKVKEAAQRLGVSEQYIRIGIQRGWLPIGSCVKIKQRWNYIIPRTRFEAYMTGQDIKMPSAATDGAPLSDSAERV